MYKLVVVLFLSILKKSVIHSEGSTKKEKKSVKHSADDINDMTQANWSHEVSLSELYLVNDTRQELWVRLICD